MPGKLLAFGEPLFELSQVEENGRTVFLSGHGGDTSNVAVAAARQGAAVQALAHVGDDAFGDSFVHLWQDEGIDTTHVTRNANAPTGVYFITHEADGHEFTYRRAGSAASLIAPHDLPEQALRECAILHVSGISQAISDSACDAVFAAIDLARSGGARISYDTNLRLKLWPLPRARAVILATIAQTDDCLPSLEDARTLTGLDDHSAIVDDLLGRGAKTVVLKLGAQGALLADGRIRERIAPYSVDVVDATGAGDTFDGAFLAERLRGASLVDAARYANAAAALSTTGHGAVGPIPTRQAVEAFMASHG